MQPFAGVRLRLPATSANLGPGFDTIGLALSLHLTVEAQGATATEIRASGRNADVCGSLENNLLLETYEDVMRQQQRPVLPLRLSLQNEIPLGMGCGSSAAALLAGVALANHFGRLGWDDAQIVAEGSRREGHPDNIAACWYGGFTVSAQDDTGVKAVTCPVDSDWEMLLALPGAGLATRTARALLPEEYSKADAVFNLQRVALLTAAFAQRKPELLGFACEDRLHQPYRLQACPLLPLLLPLRADLGVAAVTLSGAGPSVLLILRVASPADETRSRVRDALPQGVELLSVRAAGGASTEVLGDT